MATLPETGFLRLNQIVGQKAGGKFKRAKREDIPALVPVCRSTFLTRVKDGIYPQPVRLGTRTIAWRVEDIRALIEKLGA